LSAFYTATDHFTLLPAILLALFGCVAFVLSEDERIVLACTR
jgi:hypothetical protein